MQSHNTRLKKNNTSGVRGVNFNKRTGKWMVRLWVDGKRKSFGYFYDLEEAINARKEAEIKYLGFQIDENGIVE
nr:AP2 domain-containing protein [Vagococcus fluvialis]